VTNYDEDPSVENEIVDLEIVIDRPVSQVWNKWMDLSSWVTSHDIEQVAGTRDAVGGITRVSYRAAKEIGPPPPHYHYNKVIHVVPEKQYVLKSYAEKGGSYGQYFIGFDETRFYAMDGKTRVSFRFFGHSQGAADVVVKNPDKAKEFANVPHMQMNLENLKRLLESEPRIKE